MTHYTSLIHILPGNTRCVMRATTIFDPRFRKAFDLSRSSLLELTRANPIKGLSEIVFLAGVGWNELV